MDIAMGLTGLAFLFFWIAVHENTRKKHEALSLLFFFFGFGIVLVDILSMAQEARALTYYNVEGMLVVLMQVTVFMFIFVLLYFLLKYATSVFTFLGSIFNSSGRDDEE